MRQSPESLVIRPPSEWRSMLVRVTRGCPWNRCRFCGLYPSLGQASYSARPVAEVLDDIELLRQRVPCITTAFLGDADPLAVPVHDIETICGRLRRDFPRLERITAYARISTLYTKKAAGIRLLAGAGIGRVHAGLESGDREVLAFHKKGLSPEILVEVAGWLRDAGIELSLYVLLGLGGADGWQRHIDGTADALNRARPDFIRVRRLWIYAAGENGVECPLNSEVRAGTFLPQTPEGTVIELRRLLGGLYGFDCRFTCDHANNHVQVEGSLPQDRARMLGEIDAFLALPPHERQQRYAARAGTI